MSEAGNGAREAMQQVIDDLSAEGVTGDDEAITDIILLKLAMAGYVVRPLQEH